MSKRGFARQSGLSMTTLLIWVVIIGLGAVLGIKVAPDVIEYGSIMSSLKAVAADPATRTASVAQIRAAYDKRAQIDRIEAVKGVDLDVTKEGNDVVISFAYTKKIKLYGPISLAIDFEGSSAK